jgi:hypothetical protein
MSRARPEVGRATRLADATRCGAERRDGRIRQKLSGNCNVTRLFYVSAIFVITELAPVITKGKKHIECAKKPRFVALE